MSAYTVERKAGRHLRASVHVHTSTHHNRTSLPLQFNLHDVSLSQSLLPHPHAIKTSLQHVPRLLRKPPDMRRLSSAASARMLSTTALSEPHAVLHKTRIPTLHFQDSLPKLPLPKLEDTLKRMVYSAGPLCSQDEMEEAHHLVAEFAASDGPVLQAALEDRDRRSYSSFISQPWFELYLRDRRPVLLNHNPALIFADEEGAGRSGPGSQVGRAARLVHAATTFDRPLASGCLEPDIFHTQPSRSKTSFFNEVVRVLPRSVAFYGAAACGAFPLDMSQYANLLRSTRKPGPQMDELVVSPGSRHIIVQRRGAFFKVDVLDEDGGTVPLAELHAALKAVVDAADAAPASADEALGLLTSLPRDRWAELRRQLEASDGANAAALADIDSSLFALSLEPDGAADAERRVGFFLHGSGIDRWLDKSFQVRARLAGPSPLVGKSSIAARASHAPLTRHSTARVFTRRPLAHSSLSRPTVRPPSTSSTHGAMAWPSCDSSMRYTRLRDRCRS